MNDKNNNKKSGETATATSHLLPFPNHRKLSALSAYVPISGDRSIAPPAVDTVREWGRGWLGVIQDRKPQISALLQFEQIVESRLTQGGGGDHVTRGSSTARHSYPDSCRSCANGFMFCRFPPRCNLDRGPVARFLCNEALLRNA